MIKKITLLSFALLFALIWIRNQDANRELSPFENYQPQSTPEKLSFTKTTKAQTSDTTIVRPKTESQSKQESVKKTGSQNLHFEADEHAYTEDGELLVSQILVIEENAIAHGDILIGSYDEMLEFEKRGELPQLPPPALWEKGIVPFVIDPDYSYPDRIQRVIDYFHNETPIRFVERDERTEDYVLFTSGPEHCFAHFGKRSGEQKVVLSSGCQEREIAHEIMHVLGFLHEQNREDRDQHLSIHWENIEEVYHEQFKKMPNPFTPGLTLPFDLSSVMIYSPFSFAVDTNRPTMTKKNGELYEQTADLLSEGDKKKIKLLYR